MYKVIDMVYYDDENNIAFEGTMQECEDFIYEAAFGSNGTRDCIMHLAKNTKNLNHQYTNKK